MDSKLVYRSLRQISQWTLDGFYSEVHVSGQENIPEEGPLIITPCHHNEILDIATLSVTIPHRRPVCFWAKSSMFANPIARAIMTSSGSIPVRRNPNRTAGAGEKSEHGADSHFALFRETFRALDKGEVVGVFPEGTSYTEPHIAQVKEGAAWAALEYARWQMQHAAEYAEGSPKKLVIVPVGVVYTDKTRFQSKVLVRYGEPIDVEAYARRHLASNDPRAEVKELTAEIEKRLVDLTINAKDWDHHLAGTIVREICYPRLDESAPDSYVKHSQELMSRLEEERPDVTSKLATYAGLLHHTGLTHLALSSLYPLPTLPSRPSALFILLRESLTTLVHPRFLAFLPMALLHAPAYASGALAGRFLANRREPETIAEHKAVCAGLAFGATSALVGNRIAQTLHEGLCTAVKTGRLSGLPSAIVKACAWATRKGSLSASIARLAGTAVVIYCTTWLLFRWHRALVGWNYERMQRVSAAWTVALGVWFPPSRALTSAELERTSRSPLPKTNAFIKRASAPSPLPEIPRPPKHQVPSPRALVAHLFTVRAQAEAVSQQLLTARHATSS
ncbi:glycerol-3-phosphate-1-acyltransferase-like domain-containing protein [Phanerochaete sordida]|uniref:Glycerol-3-phosphate-1-acyltransferase-like domain-containing protein n=1 Tax=Phanerochaete sordida TaxID=48140 RepID=A0A9P3GET0_9APHY|nr:glycerol-3-phosphate-1-acyltransferase-like domain-containing protein [Phanerochaete sordida]